MEQKNITYTGITNRPSDFSSKDGELADCINLAPDAGELRVIEEPVKIFDTEGETEAKLIYVHKTANSTNYILEYLSEQNNTLFFKNGSTGDFNEFDTLTESVKSITAIGNTLCVVTENNMYYYLWKLGNTYLKLGQKPPFLELQFYTYPFKTTDSDALFNTVTDLDYIQSNWVSDEQQKKDIATGYYAILYRNIAKVKETKCFCQPFLVTYAYRLYDGTHTMRSNPCLMNLCLAPSMLIPVNHWTKSDILHVSIESSTIYSKLGYTVKGASDYPYEDHSSDKIAELKSNWGDVITGIDIFISQPILTYDTLSSMGIYQCKGTSIPPGSGVSADSEYLSLNAGHATFQKRAYFSTTSDAQSSDLVDYFPYKLLDYKFIDATGFPYLGEKEIFESIRNESVFYKISNINLSAIPALNSTNDVEISTNVLENLTQQETLDSDYRSYAINSPSGIFTYNSRINVYNNTIKYGKPFAVDTCFSYCENAKASDVGYKIKVEIYVYLENDDVSMIKLSPEVDTTRYYTTAIPVYLYCPIGDAKKALMRIIVESEQDSSVIKTFSRVVLLQQHKGLDGAVWTPDSLEEMYLKLTGTTTYWNVEGEITNYDTAFYNSDGTIKAEYGSNSTKEAGNIQTSEVNNPFVFKAAGVTSVGVGGILGVSVATRALSTGQFGQYPLYVFSSDGIWALSVGSDGYFSTVSPVSADVCSNAKSICQLDGGVVFSTEKGLMLIYGSDIKCISNAVSGRSFSLDETGAGEFPTQLGTAPFSPKACNDTSFMSYLKNCFITFDYANQRILICNPEKDYQWIYSLESQSFSKMCFGKKYARTVPTAPSYLLQDTTGVVYELDFNSSENVGSVGAYLITRPLILGTTELKTIRKLLHRNNFDLLHSESYVKIKLFGTRDMVHFQELRSLNGSGMAAYRLVMYFKMKPSDRYAATAFYIEVKTTGSPT